MTRYVLLAYFRDGQRLYYTGAPDPSITKWHPDKMFAASYPHAFEASDVREELYGPEIAAIYIDEA